MQIIGLITEYNPLHLGHIYQIKKIKELYPNSIIIVITNGSFTQRGDVAILNKYAKTKLCLEHQIDLIIELPFPYATQSADIFAKGALEILNHLQINTLVFGSESNNLTTLTTIAATQLTDKNYHSKVKYYLTKGLNYPTAMNKALLDITGLSVNEPNDLLAISYLKEIIKNNYPIAPISIQRIGNYHEKEITNSIISASLIRNLFTQKQDITPYIPKNVDKYLTKNLTLESYFPYLKYKIITSQDLTIYQDVEEGIENRLKKFIHTSTTWQELIEHLKTKRYTYNKINRMLIHILTSFTKEEAHTIKIDYIKVLGFNQIGQQHLNKIKKELTVPLIYRYQKNLSLLLDIELRATSIYNLPLTNQSTLEEYKNKPIIKNN